MKMWNRIVSLPIKLLSFIQQQWKRHIAIKLWLQGMLLLLKFSCTAPTYPISGSCWQSVMIFPRPLAVTRLDLHIHSGSSAAGCLCRCEHIVPPAAVSGMVAHCFSECKIYSTPRWWCSRLCCNKCCMLVVHEETGWFQAAECIL